MKKVNPQDEVDEAVESNNDTLMSDRALSRSPYPSEAMPEDYYQYRKFVNLPEAQSEFEGVIDKDVVFSNLSNAEREMLNYKVNTIQWTREIFVLEVDVWINKNDSKIYAFSLKDIPESDREDYVLKRTVIPDPDFLPIMNVLKAGYKFAIVSSRAVGPERAAILDNTTMNRISKEFERRKSKRDGLTGLGGN